MKARAKAVRRSPAPKLTAVRRAQNTGYSNYGANVQKKSMRGWEYYGGDAKRDIEDNINTLRQRSRDAYMGVPTATAALKTLRRHPDSKAAMATAMEVERFFHSQWYSQLTQIDPDYLIERLRKEAAK